MTEPCPDTSELGRVDDLAADHPLRRHLRDCGRCRAALAAIRSFEAGRAPAEQEEVSVADLADADARLAAFIEQDLLGEKNDPVIRLWFRRTPPRSWLALAAVLVVAVGFWLVGPRPGGDAGRDQGPLRGETVPDGPSFGTVEVTRATDGSLAVAWAPREGAQDYVIVLWSSDLAEVARLEPSTTADHRFTAHPDARFLSVVARQGGREIARSALVTLP
jgi:hypothetical protein